MFYVNLSLNAKELKYLSRLVVNDAFSYGDDVPAVAGNMCDLLHEAAERLRSQGCYVFHEDSPVPILERAFQLRVELKDL